MFQILESLTLVIKSCQEKVIKNIIGKVMKKRFVKYFLLDVKCVARQIKMKILLLFYADYFMKIGCFKSLKKSSKQSIFSKVTGLQGCRPVNLVKVAPFHWRFPRNLTKRCKLIILLIAPAKTLGHEESFSPTCFYEQLPNH